jgi:hypothetical protein
MRTFVEPLVGPRAAARGSSNANGAANRTAASILKSGDHHVQA